MPLNKEVLDTLKQNVKQTAETLALLRKQVSILEKEANRSDSKIQVFYEQKKLELKKENQELQKKVEYLKKEIEKVERENGLKIVPCPKASKQSTSQEASVCHMTSPNSNEQAVVKDEKPSQGEEKKTKAKKEKKPPKVKESAAEHVADIDASRLDLRVGCIVKVQKHPDADTLYLEEIDVGEEKPRTVVSGLVEQIPIEKMQNRMVMVLCNLKPAKMRGVFSEAMVMCASSPDCVEILDPPSGSVPGDKVVCEGYPGTPDAQLNPKKKIFEKIQPDLHTDEQCVAKYKGSPFVVVGKDGYFKSQTMKNSNIK